tara:strand:+ start:164 stop:661 length:498 start_codon:yes stop_codon:yes gene_type:complete
MALTFSKTGISDGSTIQPSHVTQSYDAFTKQAAYDITLSGSFTMTGSFNHTGSFSFTGSVASKNGFTGSLEGQATSAVSASAISGIANNASTILYTIVGSDTLSTGAKTINITALTTKFLGTSCWVVCNTINASHRVVTPISLTGANLLFTGTGTDTFHYIIQYS